MEQKLLMAAVALQGQAALWTKYAMRSHGEPGIAVRLQEWAAACSAGDRHLRGLES